MSRRSFDFRRETRIFTSTRTSAYELIAALEGCESVLDVGCGRASPLRFLNCKRLVGVDAFEPDLARAAELGTHDEFVRLDARRIRERFGDGEFDACAAVDVIEHFTREDGVVFLRALEKIARRIVLISTPNGFLRQMSAENGDHQEHLSGWNTAEMRREGYDVIGLNGLRFLRGEHHSLRFRPAVLWALLSWISQHLWCRNHPEWSAALLCVKRKQV